MIQRRPLNADEALDRLRELCSRGELCSSDALRRMNRWKIFPDEARSVLDRLIKEKFIDDLRFARAYVRDKYRFSSWGRYKIRSGLHIKAIPRDIIVEALKEIDYPEYQRIAFDAFKAKLRQLDPSEERCELRAKLMKFGITRGFESQLCQRILYSRSLWRD